MLSEIAKTKGSLETIQVGNRDLIFKQGKYIFVLLLANKNLGVYHSILMDLARQIEESNPRIANFNGDLMSLNIPPIVDHYFGPEPKLPELNSEKNEICNRNKFSLLLEIHSFTIKVFFSHFSRKAFRKFLSASGSFSSIFILRSFPWAGENRSTPAV